MMLGFGEQYITPFALRLGATSFQVGILSSFPLFISSLFQLIGARLTEKYQDRKLIVTRAVLAQAITLIPLFAIPFLTGSILTLTVIFCAYLAFGNLMGPAWNSWLGDVIPIHERAAYFSRRNKWVTLSLFLSVLCAGLVLSRFERTNIWLGFLILFGLAFLGRFVSFLMFFRHHEPRYHAPLWLDLSFGDFLQHLTTSDLGNFVIFRTSVSFAVMVAAPFFSVYMLTALGFSYAQYSIIILGPMLVKALTMTYWGGFSQRFGNRAIMQVCSVLIAFIPLNWFLVVTLFPHSWSFPLLLAVEIISGFAWAGFELTTFNYLLDQSSPQRRARLFAYYTVVFGFMVFIGGILGSALLKLFSSAGFTFEAILFVFLVSASLRLVVSMVFIPRVRDFGNHVKVSQGRVFYEVLLHRPFGHVTNGLVSRLAIIERRLSRENGKNRVSGKRKR